MRTWFICFCALGGLGYMLGLLPVWHDDWHVAVGSVYLALAVGMILDGEKN